MNVKFAVLQTAISILGLFTHSVHAGAIAVVNGVEIPQSAMEIGLANGLRQGLIDNETVRNLIRSELVNLEVISQRAKVLNLDQTASAKTRLEQAHKTVLGELLYETFNKKNPIKDDELRSEFDRQTKALRGEKQYNLRLILTASKEVAYSILDKLRDKDDFGTLALQYSVDSSARQGGALGWVLNSQVVPSIANVMVNMSSGAVSALPIATQEGWYVIKLEGVREFVPPNFDDVKALLRQNMVKSQWREYVNGLLTNAAVSTPEEAATKRDVDRSKK